MFAKPGRPDEECPSEVLLEQYAAKQLYGPKAEYVYTHLKHCSECLRRISELSKVPSPDAIISGKTNPWWQRLLALIKFVPRK